MTVEYTIYDPTTTAIIIAGEFTAETMQLQAMRDDWGFLLHVVGNPDTHYVVDGALVPYSAAELAAKQALPKGWAWSMPARIAVDLRPLAGARHQAWDRIKAARDVAEKSDFTHGGKVYQADRERINGAVTAAILAQFAGHAYTVNWILSDNTTLELDGAQMMALGAALAARVKDVFQTSVDLRAAIAAVPEESPTANAELDAINWPSQEP